MDSSPTTLIVETTANEECPIDFLGDSADIVYFISFAHSERYGADHPLAKASSILKRKLGIKLGPLLNYADARTENKEEEEHLERMWQDPVALQDCARAVADALETSADIRELLKAFPELPDRLRELADMAVWATAQGAKMRLTYVI
ncbi:MAG: hypothetical protein IH957_07500 [Chloroflexi bacterium]|nr:hypothetical protein [Chloroflexota bacterium]